MKIYHKCMVVLPYILIFGGISYAKTNSLVKQSDNKELVGYCGDGIVNGNEHCDGKALSVSSCKSLGGPEEGKIKCQSNCVFDISECIQSALFPSPSILLPAEPIHDRVGFCGDGIINGDEYCDGNTMSDKYCHQFSGLGGELHCRPDCKLDISECVLEPLRQERALRDRLQ